MRLKKSLAKYIYLAFYVLIMKFTLSIKIYGVFTKFKTKIQIKVKYFK